MPSYNLTQTQVNIVTTWLFEVQGYLDLAVNDLGQSARQALSADLGLDVTDWVRTQTKGPQTDQRDWDECGMVWWILVNDQVNIPQPQLPPEKATWAAILHVWDDSINAGFQRVGQGGRNVTSRDLIDPDGNVVQTIQSGAHLAQQQQMISQVLGVLE